MHTLSVKVIVNHVNAQDFKCAWSCPYSVLSAEEVAFLLSESCHTPPCYESPEYSSQDPDGPSIINWNRISRNWISYNNIGTSSYIMGCLCLNFSDGIRPCDLCFGFCFLFWHEICSCGLFVSLWWAWRFFFLRRWRYFPGGVRISPTLEIWIINWISILRVNRWWRIAFLALPVIAFLMHWFKLFPKPFIFFPCFLCLLNKQLPLFIKLSHHSLLLILGCHLNWFYSFIQVVFFLQFYFFLDLVHFFDELSMTALFLGRAFDYHSFIHFPRFMHFGFWSFFFSKQTILAIFSYDTIKWIGYWQSHLPLKLIVSTVVWLSLGGSTPTFYFPHQSSAPALELLYLYFAFLAFDVDRRDCFFGWFVNTCWQTALLVLQLW